jgi:ferritin-like metal-binding protein YciE
LEETKQHVERLTQVFGILNLPPKGKKCKAMEGLLAEGDEVISEEEAGELRDLALIAACQRVEHYEISAYGSARAIASRLGLDEAVDLLEQTENEEGQADQKLSDVAGSIYDNVNDDEGGTGDGDGARDGADKPEHHTRAKRAPAKAAADRTKPKK